jgi:outer membrane protein assembly factor BamB
VWFLSAALLCTSFFSAPPDAAQTLKLSWKKDFPKNVSWYVRTSPGILLVRSGKSLTALDGEDGRQLWEIQDVRISDAPLPGMLVTSQRGLNILEVPGMGVLLVNEAKLAGNSNPRLIALNLMTGKLLWNEAPVDELMTAIPLYKSGQIIVVSRRAQKKILGPEVVASLVTPAPGSFALGNLLPYPYRFEFERMDLASGKILWSKEYEHTLTPGPTSVRAFGDYLFVYFSNHMLACLDTASGKLLWEDGSKHFGSGSLSLPLQMANGWLVYGSSDVQAVDPGTAKME